MAGASSIFSVVAGPAKWASVGALGACAAGGIVWTLFHHNDRRVEPLPLPSPPAIIQPFASDGGAVRTEPTLVMRGGMQDGAQSGAPEAGEAPALARTPKGPGAEEEAGGVRTVQPAAQPVAPQPTQPAAPQAPALKESRKPTPAAPTLATPRKVNVNTATKAELELLPGIGPALADRIIQARTTKRFRRIEDLDAVKGIGEKMIEKLRGRVVFEDAPAK